MTQQCAVPALLELLLKAPGVSGSETKVISLIELEVMSHGLSVHRDQIGNIWTTMGNGRPHILLLAHTDEVGFTICAINVDGTVLASPVGHWDLEILSGIPIEIYTESGIVPGVTIDSIDKPKYLESMNPSASPTRVLMIDLGVDSSNEVRELGVDLSDPILLRRERLRLDGLFYKARGLDNRLGCHLLLEVVTKLADTGLSKGSVTVAWTAQEEVGFRGSLALRKRFRQPFDAVIAVDAFPGIRGPISGSHDTVRLGLGPVLRQADLSGIMSTKLAERIQQIAATMGIPLQRAFAPGHTQASVFHHSPSIALDFPTAYLHSRVECVHVNDVSRLGTLLVAIARTPEEVSVTENYF